MSQSIWEEYHVFGNQCNSLWHVAEFRVEAHRGVHRTLSQKEAAHIELLLFMINKGKFKGNYEMEHIDPDKVKYTKKDMSTRKRKRSVITWMLSNAKKNSVLEKNICIFYSN